MTSSIIGRIPTPCDLRHIVEFRGLVVGQASSGGVCNGGGASVGHRLH